MSDDGDDWSDYQSGPFCRHWGDPGDCDEKCANCGHSCCHHDQEYDGVCNLDNCECKGWADVND